MSLFFAECNFFILRHKKFIEVKNVGVAQTNSFDHTICKSGILTPEKQEKNREREGMG